MICMRGSRPICTAWRATEKAPEMTACEAMTVASVARIDHRDQRPVGRQVVERAFDGARLGEQQRPLAEVVEDQRRHDEGEPGEADRQAAEVAHVGIERLAAGDGQDHRTEGEEGQRRMTDDEADGVEPG